MLNEEKMKVVDWVLAFGCAFIIPHLYVYVAALLALYQVDLMQWFQVFGQRMALYIAKLTTDTGAAVTVSAIAPYLLGIFLHQRPLPIAVTIGIISALHFAWIFLPTYESQRGIILYLVQLSAYPVLGMCCGIAVILGYHSQKLLSRFG